MSLPGVYLWFSTNVSSLSIPFSEIRKLSHLCKTLSSLLNNPANSPCTSFRLNSPSVAHQNQVAVQSVARALILFCASIEMTLPRQLGIISHFPSCWWITATQWWITGVLLVDHVFPTQPWAGEHLRCRQRHLPLCLMGRIRQFQ